MNLVLRAKVDQAPDVLKADPATEIDRDRVTIRPDADRKAAASVRDVPNNPIDRIGPSTGWPRRGFERLGCGTTRGSGKEDSFPFLLCLHHSDLPWDVWATLRGLSPGSFSPLDSHTIRVICRCESERHALQRDVGRSRPRFEQGSAVPQFDIEIEGYGRMSLSRVRVGIIGAGAVSDFHHVPGIRLDPRATLAAVCDPNQALLDQRKNEWGSAQYTTDFHEVARNPDVDAVVIATPNFTHREIALACIAEGKHVMAEKPLGVSAAEAVEMYQAAKAKNVRHMTAFTYRFAPSMRYLRSLVKSGSLGEPRHFRSQRFLDWPETSWGWRQYKRLAGAGDLYDMTIHRIDFAQDLMGRIQSVCGAVATFVPRDRTVDGKTCDPSDVDDWSALIGRFESGAVGVWEGSTLMKGHHNEGVGFEWAEVNGSEGSAVYQLVDPNYILVGRHGGTMQKMEVPAEFMKPADSPRDPKSGKPSTVFRYDLMWEFVSAIVEGRDCMPGFDDGASAQVVADAVLKSSAERRWVDVPKLG